MWHLNHILQPWMTEAILLSVLPPNILAHQALAVFGVLE